MREALRGRSGNRPPRHGDGDSDGDGAGPAMGPPGCGWARTRAALARLEAALRCSRCGSVLREPVSLGRCEHVFCLSCVGDCVGRECPACHTPAWVQDAQINRQLDNMIQLCSKLRHLLGEDASDSTQVTSAQPGPDCEAKGKKEQIKMWFSPRSRKIRCTLSKRQPVTKSNNVCEDPSSVYHFFPSPPHEKPPKQVKKPTHKLSKKMKKKRLADINKVWGFQKLKQKGEVEQICNREKCVTICSQPVTLCTPEPNSPEESLQQESVKDSSRNMENLRISPQVRFSEKKVINADVCPAQGSKEEVCVPEKPLSVVNEATPLKRGREQVRFPVTSESKRPRRSERILTRSSGSQESCLEELPQGSPISLLSESLSPVRVCSSVSKRPVDTIMKTRSSAHSQEINSPSLSEVPSTPSTSKTCNQIGIPPSPSVLKSPGSNMITRRNHKGETLLHVASIKGDLAAVEQLLKNGADPNVKDNAGWTPLHEACNHGHKEVVELLLQHRALVNTTGYQNDSPLHDAAKNGHVSVVKLLLLHGASRDAVNIFGLRPVDYAESEKMKSVLQLPMRNASLPLNQPSEDIQPVVFPPLRGNEMPLGQRQTKSARPMSPSQPREGPLGILGSNLSSEQQKLLNKLAAALKARRCTEFNSTVTHLVVPDAPMPSTVKCMMAVLTGCWVLKFEWVRACLQTKAREQEEKYEVQGGPQRGRLNREQLLPKLFDGCYFYFLGSFTRPQKSDLSELVKAAGGQVLVRQPKPESDVTQTVNTVAYHAEPASDQRFCTQYVIYDTASKFKPEKIRQGKVWMAPSSWLVDCVMSFQLLPVK